MWIALLGVIGITAATLQSAAAQRVMPPRHPRDTIRQPYRAYMPKHSLLVGTAYGGYHLRVRQSVNSPWENANSQQLDPRVAFLFSERVALGIEATWGKSWGSLVPEEEFYGFGAFGRYFLFTKRRQAVIDHERIPFFGRGQLFKKADDRTRRLFAQHFFPFVELGWGMSNIRRTPMGYVTLPRATEQYFRMALGMDIRLWKFIFAEASYMQLLYIDNAQVPRSHIGMRAGIDFVFPLAKRSK
jgi:hypothetical protein